MVSTFMAVATAVAPRRTRPGAPLEALDPRHHFPLSDWCRGAIKAFRLATLSATARIHRIQAVADELVAKPTF